MIAAIYARKSTEQNGVSEEQKSIARQIEHARAYAADKGWTVNEDCIFTDDGISGAEFLKRPGFLRLMNSLKPYPPFSVLIMSEESRLGREAIETAYAWKQILRASVRVFFYLEDRERTLDSPTDKIMLSLTAFADELEREKARQRTYDAMQRKARAGHVTGGSVFGYDNAEIKTADGKRSHVERRVNEQQAAAIRRIFQLRADGHGLKAIAKTLNGERAPSPRPQRNRPAGWVDSSVREVLHRDLYRGVITWNRTRKRDKDGQIRQRPRPAAEHIEIPAPQLRIVSDELWKAAHRRIEADRKRYAGKPNGKPNGWGTAARGTYLLTGLARCSECGGGIEVQTRSHGSQRAKFYTCATSYKRGTDVCGNRVAIRTELADAAVLEMIERAVLSSEIGERAIQEATRRITQRRAGTATREKEIRALQREAENLTRALATGGSITIADEIRKREAEIAALQAEERAHHARAKNAPNPTTLRRELTEKARDWRTCLQGEPRAARRVLGACINGRLTFRPISDHDGEAYEITGTATAEELLAGKTLLEVASPTGFEPVFWP